MPQSKDFLLELGTEELPSKNLQTFAMDLANQLSNQLTQMKLTFGKVHCYATPRRLAVLVKELVAAQADYEVEKKGPNIQMAFDDQGQPTQAALGFARACKVSISALQTLETANGACLAYRYGIKGSPTEALLPDICRNAIASLTFAKPMRWGQHTFVFIRPVHWVVMLYGEKLIDAEFFGLKTGRTTLGHRFHHPQPIALNLPTDYDTLLKTPGYVIVDFHNRRHTIREQVQLIAENLGAQAIIEDALLDEITGLVEWPQALLGKFAENFLQVPKEALISAMKVHQKAFHLVNSEGNLLPYFITVSNIASTDPALVTKGNERVMRARLADAAFFYQTDCKQSLESMLDRLKGVVFQAKLGNLYNQSERLSALAELIADKLHSQKLDCPPALAARAGLLAKADLTSEMVGEFPDLQGIMGYYYALHEGLPPAVATAIRDHYLPRFAGDNLPQTALGCAVALADRLDKLVGIFGINQQPTADKDPYALRRAAIGIVRICIEKELDIDLLPLLEHSVANYKGSLPNKEVIPQVKEFLLERLRTWYLEAGMEADVINAVLERNITSPYDFHRRVIAVNAFRRLPEAAALAIANKRVNNLLNKENVANFSSKIDPALFEKTTEVELAALVAKKAAHVAPLYRVHDYKAVLTELASLQTPIDRFFDDVMVMVEDQKIRNNRVALLIALRELFFQVADISQLQGS